MGTIASQITSLTMVYSIVDSGADQRKYQSSVSLAFVREIYRWPVNSPHKWPVTREIFPFDDTIMYVFKIIKKVMLMCDTAQIWLRICMNTGTSSGCSSYEGFGYFISSLSIPDTHEI